MSQAVVKESFVFHLLKPLLNDLLLAIRGKAKSLNLPSPSCMVCKL